jgi:alkanesulfonate monooxygenase SsuD/methylene tetrahydromethanopterin reductase-like flavin-dependent oxidoreductase (luciferase family)
MTSIGYFLSSEEHPGSELVRAAGLAERAGFEALWISDHFHPPLRSCSAETAAAPERP